MANPLQELDVHLTNWAQLLGDRYGFVTGKLVRHMLPIHVKPCTCHIRICHISSLFHDCFALHLLPC